MSKETYILNFEKDRKSKMIYAFAIDLVGYFSYLIPSVAEISDLFWAPVAAVLIFLLYRIKPRLAFIGALGALVEEFLPFFDFIPTAMLLWILIYVIDQKETIELYRKKEEDELVVLEDED